MKATARTSIGHLDLSAEEATALIALLTLTIDDDRYPPSPRVGLLPRDVAPKKATTAVDEQGRIIRALREFVTEKLAEQPPDEEADRRHSLSV